MLKRSLRCVALISICSLQLFCARQTREEEPRSIDTSPAAVESASSDTAPAQAASDDLPPNYQGFSEVVTCDELGGWAWNTSDPSKRVRVRIVSDRLGTVSEVDADQFRQDLLAANIGDGKHSFSVPTPAAVKDGKSHEIDLVVGSFQLQGGPRTLRCEP